MREEESMNMYYSMRHDMIVKIAWFCHFQREQIRSLHRNHPGKKKAVLPITFPVPDWVVKKYIK